MNLYSQSFDITPRLKTALVSCLTSSTPSSSAGLSISAMMLDGPATSSCFIMLSGLWIRVIDTLGGGGSWKDLGDLNVWPLKLNNKQPGIMPNPCFHHVFTKKMSASSSLLFGEQFSPFCLVHLFVDTENTITNWVYCGEFLLLCLKLCQPDDMFCHVLGIKVDSFFTSLASTAFPSLIVDIKPCNSLKNVFSLICHPCVRQSSV